MSRPVWDAERVLRLTEAYERVRAALQSGDIASATVLMAEADALVAAEGLAGDPGALAALAPGLIEAHRAAAAALAEARARLLRAATAELRPGGGAGRAYASGDGQPDARFIDRQG